MDDHFTSASPAAIPILSIYTNTILSPGHVGEAMMPPTRSRYATSVAWRRMEQQSSGTDSRWHVARQGERHQKRKANWTPRHTPTGQKRNL
jgi:hypothetical protein